jgi:SAM-dependent methyltransferase
MSSRDDDSKQLPWTGERYVPEIQGNIALEHRHRYALASELAAGKSALDIACGEGYGSAMLAEVAQYVVGVDSSRDVILHASRRYARANLEFKIGSCADLPLATHSVDLVASFETIEHHDQHEQMLLEIKRVLRPDGVLVVSSPDKYEYSIVPNYTNPYHVKELYRHEFEELLSRHFNRCAIYGQRVLYGSAILQERVASRVSVYGWDGARHRESNGMPRPQYIIAVASDGELPAASSGVFEQPLNESDIIRGWANTVAERDEQIRSLQNSVAELKARLERSEADSARMRDLETHARIHGAKVTEELEQLKDAGAARERVVETLQSELDQVKEGGAARERDMEALRATLAQTEQVGAAQQRAVDALKEVASGGV